MHRRDLLDKLERYAAEFPAETAVVARMRAFVERRADCFSRGCIEGHITGSAWIASLDRRLALLLHHAKLGRWLQPGGHADGDSDTRAVALREAREECGLSELALLRDDPFDLDIHEIPAREGEPAHLHYDVRYLLAAALEAPLRRNDEARALHWFAAGAPEILREESLARMARKASRPS